MNIQCVNLGNSSDKRVLCYKTQTVRRIYHHYYCEQYIKEQWNFPSSYLEGTQLCGDTTGELESFSECKCWVSGCGVRVCMGSNAQSKNTNSIVFLVIFNIYTLSLTNVYAYAHTNLYTPTHPHTYTHTHRKTQTHTPSFTLMHTIQKG